MNYLSVCSGIEAATVAWEPLGFSPNAFSEIEKFPCAVLAHHYPNVPNFGDMTRYKEWDIEPGSVDILVGGTPCQSFSVAGLRKGLDDPRGNLALVYLGIAERLRPRWLLWENVPGVLSVDKGRAFGSFLGGLGQLGYGFSYRVLDAQYFGVPQRRRRVFVVGHLGDWRPATAVLFERHSLQWHTPPSRAKGKVTPAIPASGAGTGRTGNERTELDMLVAGSIGSHRSGGWGNDLDNNGAFIPVAIQNGVRIPRDQNGIGISDDDVMYTLDQTGAQAVAYSDAVMGDGRPGRSTLRSGRVSEVYSRTAVRRLTPTECERLQGFPDGYTLIPYNGKPACDGPRYRALGNSMAVPCMRWLGERIREVDAIATARIFADLAS